MRRRKRLSRPAICPDQIFEAIEQCWAIDPASRVNAERIHELLLEFWDSHQLDRELQSLNWPINQKNRLTISASNVEFQGIDLDSASETAAFAQLEVCPSDVILQKQLGSGAFGTVNLGVLRESIHVAVKTLKTHDVEIQQKFMLEARLLSAVRHPNIVAIVGVCSQQPNMILLELMHGDLKHALMEMKKSPQMPAIEDLLGAMLQIGEAMQFLSNKKIIHRDLAARSAIICHATAFHVSQKCACRI